MSMDVLFLAFIWLVKGVSVHVQLTHVNSFYLGLVNPQRDAARKWRPLLGNHTDTHDLLWM